MLGLAEVGFVVLPESLCQVDGWGSRQMSNLWHLQWVERLLTGSPLERNSAPLPLHLSWGCHLTSQRGPLGLHCKAKVP